MKCTTEHFTDASLQFGSYMRRRIYGSLPVYHLNFVDKYKCTIYTHIQEEKEDEKKN